MGNFVEFYEFLRLQMVFGIVRCSDIVILIQLFYEISQFKFEVQYGTVFNKGRQSAGWRSRD